MIINDGFVVEWMSCYSIGVGGRRIIIFCIASC